MAHHMMIGCDLHARSMVLAIAVDHGPVASATFPNTRDGRDRLYEDIAKRADAVADRPTITFAYEACGLGYSLHDELTHRGIACHILAPTKLPTSVKQRRDKTDAKDALRLLELLRGHLLAGNALPTSWVPPPEIRDDRELVRHRINLGEKMSQIKCQIRSLLKRGPFELAEGFGSSWTAALEERLQRLTEDGSCLGPGTRVVLASLLRQKEAIAKETHTIDAALQRLEAEPRHVAPVKALRRIGGVGLLSALVFLVELGDPTRFRNRRQVAAFLGLAPSSYESGERSDCKGHITHQGPGRVRAMLCQATWTQVRKLPGVQAIYKRRTKDRPGRRKAVVVALMRKLAVVMWHRAVEAQTSPPPAATSTRRATLYERVTPGAEGPPMAKTKQSNEPPAPPSDVRAAERGAGRPVKENNRR